MAETKSNKEYVRKWHNYIDECNLLTLTPSSDLAIRVKQAIETLKDLVIEVAKDKDLA